MKLVACGTMAAAEAKGVVHVLTFTSEVSNDYFQYSTPTSGEEHLWSTYLRDVVTCDANRRLRPRGLQSSHRAGWGSSTTDSLLHHNISAH